MRRFNCQLIFSVLLISLRTVIAADAPAAMPPAAVRTVSFVKDIKPLFEAACVQCHAKGKTKGGLSLETREALLKGGDTGPAAIVGKSGDSLIVKMVAGVDPDSVMPKKGTKWTAEQVGLLRAWIDQGMPWDAGVTFAKPEPLNLKASKIVLPEGQEEAPLDRLLAAYAKEHNLALPAAVDDRTFARRAYLDTIGLMPTPTQLQSFLDDTSPNRRQVLIHQLLNDNRGYADHWLTFWNDLLRNDYRGTGFIDGGRRQISGWLYSALITNKPYDQFVAELIDPDKSSEGFSRGIIWRGTVNASMLPPMQAAQNISQVFMGVNLKCASCHDSFINDWTLADAYGLAAIYSDTPLELVHCDKPTGKLAEIRFLYPQLGTIDAKADAAARLARLSELMTEPQNGRLPRTIVNRLWQRLLGRGLVEPVDDMEKPAWSRAMLDWLADDLVEHHYDLKHTIEVILTSRAYQLPSVEPFSGEKQYTFRGPLVRRLTAEQFCDAITALTGEWARMPATLDIDFTAGHLVGEIAPAEWIWNDEPVDEAQLRADAEYDQEQQEKREIADLERTVEEKAVAAEERAKLPDPSLSDEDKPDPDHLRRHKVAFRKRLLLDSVPREAYAALSASQSFTLSVNGKDVRPILSDGERRGRIALYDLHANLMRGENVITIDVSSHTDKNLNDAEKLQYPLSRNHLNKISGVAFYLHASYARDRVMELTSDASWHTHRVPEGKFKDLQYEDEDWASAMPLTQGVTPVDEGGALPPIARKDFANEPIAVAEPFHRACTTAVQPGKIRASLLAADPLMSALDRPNREQVITVRNTAATTLQGLELTNGASLDQRLRRASQRLLPEAKKDPGAWVSRLWLQTLGREPSLQEKDAAIGMLGDSVKAENIADVLWAVTVLPELQLVR